MSPELVSIVFYATPYTRRFLIKAKQVFLSFLGFKLFILASLLTFLFISTGYAIFFGWALTKIIQSSLLTSSIYF